LFACIATGIGRTTRGARCTGRAFRPAFDAVAGLAAAAETPASPIGSAFAAGGSSFVGEAGVVETGVSDTGGTGVAVAVATARSSDVDAAFAAAAALDDDAIFPPASATRIRSEGATTSTASMNGDGPRRFGSNNGIGIGVRYRERRSTGSTLV
jgi:hypothetical protein